ncbi:MAG: hydroxysqualene dehydroxylase HpnE [Terriglobia bacterium]
MADETLIIGGGFAGLAAGVALASAGRRVRLLEQKPYLGGRARSFHHAITDATVDNGQHIFMGCYHETIKFLKTIGTVDRVRFQPRLSVHFMDRKDGLTSLKCPPLPAPWHLFAGVLKSNSFSFGEKMQVLRLGRALQSPNSGIKSQDLGRLTVDGWMAQMGQSERLRRNFWDLLCIAALNEDARIAAASVFEPVLRLALFQSAADSRIGLAAAGLSECYTGAAAAFIRTRQGEVALERNVAEFIFSGEENGAGGQRRGKTALACRGVRLADGSVIEAGAVISAIPSFQLAGLLPEAALHGEPFFSGLILMQPSPIISLNLWFDREITDLEFVGLRGTVIQWLFNKRKILRSGEPHISLVISGAHEYIQREKEELLSLAIGELRDLFPAAREAKLLHSLIIKERFATFSPDVDAAQRRLTTVTPVRGLYLAGDWTATGLPATIESAVKSGYAAAAEIMRGSAL